ncbi:hypothetical protein CYMTET_44104 [Cymbomonas tetramitiformis]|uniref:Uncharacterized protein n=1 Tax=Cymbomonas tetramitiformis TaxID=36881 RepID=A0AAE0C0X5_9CHLO|nr:hypothetical protein CYMTET_44104 [Cymbomonas tetramitiformis]
MRIIGKELCCKRTGSQGSLYHPERYVLLICYFLGSSVQTDNSECTVYERLDADNNTDSCNQQDNQMDPSTCKFCPLHVRNSEGTRTYLFTGVQTEVDSSIAALWTCRGFCPYGDQGSQGATRLLFLNNSCVTSRLVEPSDL